MWLIVEIYRSSEVKCKQRSRVLRAGDAGHVPDLDDPLRGAGHEDGRAEGVPLDAVHRGLVRAEPDWWRGQKKNSHWWGTDLARNSEEYSVVQ